MAIGAQLKLGNFYTVAGNMIAQGANLVNNSVGRTLTAVSGTLGFAGIPTISRAGSSLLLTASGQNVAFPYSVSANASILIASISTRSNTVNVLPTVSYNGVPLVAATNSFAQTSTYVNSHIFYLMNPPAGTDQTLLLNFSAPLASTWSACFATLTGVDTATAPLFATLNTDGSPIFRSLTLNDVAAGSWAVTEGTYNAGSVTTSISTTTTSGTLMTAFADATATSTATLEQCAGQ